MKRLVVDGYGKFLRRTGNQLVVTEKGQVKHRVLAEDLRQVVISGRGAISFDAMELLSEYGVDLVVLDWRGEVTSRLSTSLMRTVQTRRQQYAAYEDSRGSLLAKEFIHAKMRNQYAVLGTLAKARSETSPQIAEELMAKRQEIAVQIEVLKNVEVAKVSHIRDHLMGLEGQASRTYWDGISRVIPEPYGFPGRTGRYAEDPINAMLNYGYALLEGEVWRGIHFAGLDPYGGFLHVDRPGKPSMVLDLMEEFRQQTVDKQVIALITKSVVKPKEFEMKEGICRMSDSARRRLIGEIESTFESYVRHGDVRTQWADLILSQAVEVAKYLRGETSSYEGFYLRW
jgi:CRISPR-associated protein Cas1